MKVFITTDWHFGVYLNNLDKWLDKMAQVIDYDSTNLQGYYHKYFNPSDYINKCIEIYKRIESY
mgnify:CR=1 FL=1